MTCKHCGKTIRPHYGTYTEWIHEHGALYCRLSMAEPDTTNETKETK